MYDFTYHCIRRYLRLQASIHRIMSLSSSWSCISATTRLRNGKSALWMRRERILRNPATLAVSQSDLKQIFWIEDSCLCWTLKQVAWQLGLFKPDFWLITISGAHSCTDVHWQLTNSACRNSLAWLQWWRSSMEIPGPGKHVTLHQDAQKLGRHYRFQGISWG